MKRIYSLTILLLALALAACQQGQNQTPTSTAQDSKPNVVIVSPASNATFEVGDEVKVQSTSADAQGIVLVELAVDGQTVQNSPTPNGQPQAQFSVIQTWIALTPGKHILTVKSTNSQLASSEASISVNVIPRAAAETATLVVQTSVIPTATRLVPTATPPASATAAPPTTCTLSSTFISDVTIPDGTVIAPGGAFVKTWAIQNSGTCAWGGGYNVIFVDGNPLGASSPQPIPAANPGDIINISLNMTAPMAPGTYTSVWQLQASNGVPFGARFDAVITVPGAPTVPPPVQPTNPPPPPPPAGCNGAPQFSSFIANPLTIAPGQISTLSWGFVSNANSVFLQSPGGTQPVGTPGSLQVQPSQTTTYTLIAYCNNVPAQLQVTVTVQGGGGGCSGTPFFSGFFANPQTINAGQQTTLNWGLVQNASAVYLELPGKTEGVASPGSRNVKPAATTTYTLVAYCGNTKASISTTVNVQGGGCSGAPKFNGFTANPSTIQKGQSSTLSWGLVTNATSVVLQTPNGNSGVATPGNLSVSPKTTTTYTLIAYCKNTSVQLSVTVNVSNPPAPTPTPTPQQKTEIRNVSVERLDRGKWRVTVQYFWNGESRPARIESVGAGENGQVTTNTASTDIIPGFVKFVIQNLNTSGNGRTVKITACIVGRGNTELACKTVPAP